MDDISNILFIVLASVAALLVAIPLPKALASWNVGTSTLIFWTEFVCLVQTINAIRWNRNTGNWSPGWCDFCNYFFVTADVALAASGVSINRRLYMIVTLHPRRHEKAFTFNMVVDIVICLVVPCSSVILQYIVQQYRFFIYEDIGCAPGVGTLDLAFPFVWMLPLFAGAVSAVYACLTMRANSRRNRQVRGEPAMGWAWNRRLIALGVVSIIYGLVPTSISIALLATTYPVTPWRGWRTSHSTIDVIVYVPAWKWQSNFARAVNSELRRWTIMTLAFLVFMFLGSAADVKRMYWTPLRGVIEYVFMSQPRTILGQNADAQLNDRNYNEALSHTFFHSLALRPAPGLSHLHRGRRFIPFGRLRTERQQQNFSLTHEPILDSNIEAFELVLPISRPTAATHSSHPAASKTAL